MSHAIGKTDDTVSLLKDEDAGKFQGVFICPTASQERSSDPTKMTLRRLHYACHPRLMPRLDDRDLSKPAPQPFLQPYRISSIRRSSEICLIFDASQVFQTEDGNCLPVANNIDQNGLYTNFSPRPDRQWNYLLATNGINMDATINTPNQDYPQLSSAGQGQIRWRHGRNDTTNILFADGHAGPMQLKKNVNTDLRVRNLYVNPWP
jgi:prepilin-type processing-associated H-X9-DG protein